MSILSHGSARWRWPPWLTVALASLIIVAPWLAALLLGTQFAVLNAIVVGAAVAIAIGVAALVALVVAMFRSR